MLVSSLRRADGMRPSRWQWHFDQSFQAFSAVNASLYNLVKSNLAAALAEWRGLCAA